MERLTLDLLSFRCSAARPLVRQLLLCSLSNTIASTIPIARTALAAISAIADGGAPASASASSISGVLPLASGCSP